MSKGRHIHKGKSKRDDGLCPVQWNPGKWPYVTTCDKLRGHKTRHMDANGNVIPNLGPEQEQASEG